MCCWSAVQREPSSPGDEEDKSTGLIGGLLVDDAGLWEAVTVLLAGG